ncbi:MAG TPA: hypothetical protein VFE41_20465 [Acetobacteraceae bacterium]|jgi:hypothetical protein|nr:hypothetical protein [Acetobacteraceae bacterium]
MIEVAATVLAIVTAGFSAWLWLKASRVPLPPSTSNSWDGKGPFTDALKRQSKLNADAAKCAATAAICQTLVLLAHLVGR